MSKVSLIDWIPGIFRATDEDILQFGPQAARVRALLDFIPTMSDDATQVSGAAWDAERAAVSAAENAAARAAASQGAVTAAESAAARAAAIDAARGDASDAAWNAAMAEVVNDLIEPDVYKALINPLNAGRVFDLRAPEAGSEFMRLTRELRPASADDIERLADLSVDPRAQGIIELLGRLEGGRPLADKIRAARKLDRTSREGRRLR